MSTVGTGPLELDSVISSANRGAWGEAIHRLKRDKIAVGGAIVIVLLVLIALTAPWLAPYDPDEQFDNGATTYGMPLPVGWVAQNVRIERSPGTSGDVLLPAKTILTDQSGKVRLQTPVKTIIPANESAIEVSVTYDRSQTHLPAMTKLQIDGSSSIASATLVDVRTHLLGTDNSGRDVLSRLIYGARVSLMVGLIGVSISVCIGVVMGLLAGFFGGWVDAVIMRITDIMMSFPDLLLVMAIVAIRGPSLTIIFFAIGIIGWTGIARIVRSQVLSVREMEFIEASRAAGARNRLMIFGHVLPNVIAPVIVIATMGIAGAIMSEAALSFLGFGVKVPTASWGSMVNASLGYFRDAPWSPIIPGIAIAITVFAFNLFGDGLRDALDPRLK